MHAQGVSTLMTLLAPALHEEIVAFVFLPADRAALRGSCRYFRDVVDHMTTSLEVRQSRVHGGGIIAALPAGLLARCPDITRINLSGKDAGARAAACMDRPDPVLMEDRLGSLTTVFSSGNLLHDVAFRGAQVKDLSPLTMLTRLQSLDCSCSEVIDLAPLTALAASLQLLDCSGTLVETLLPLAALTQLRSLSCAATRGGDNLYPLPTLTALESLDCSRSRVETLAPISTLTALRHLNCMLTRVQDLAPLATLWWLRSLDCSHNPIWHSLSPGLTTLSALTTLDCSETQVGWALYRR